MIKYIVFDFDGTLVNSEEVLLSIFNQLAEKYRYKKVNPDQLELLRNLSIRERSKALKFPLYKLPLMITKFYLMYKHSGKNLKLQPGMKELLDELKDKGYSLAVISSNSEQIIREILLMNQIDYIEHIVCSDKIFGKNKVINKFMKKHKLTKEQILYVGDEHRDIVACKKCGVKIIWVTWGFDRIELVGQEDPHYIARVPAEILDIAQSG